MKRRDFIKNTGLSAGVVFAGHGGALPPEERPAGSRMLNAFYIRAHMYTLVPRNVLNDLDWMASVGTNSITVSVLEQDMSASKNNLLFIVKEARKRGMQVYMVPTRWAGIFAGGTKVPSIFSVRNPHTWRKKENGEILFTRSTGVISSIHYPEVTDFFIKGLAKAVNQWELDGVIWDEPKIWVKDFSDPARKMADFDHVGSHYQAAVNFMNHLSTGLKELIPGIKLLFYTGADTSQEILKFQKQLINIDYFGCSGLPWSSAVDKDGRQYKRYLEDKIPEFKLYASKMGLKSMAVIKNMYINPQDHPLVDQHLPKILALKPDNLTYYYYPRNLENPDQNMNLLKKHLSKFQ